MDITVLIPTFKRPATLMKTLESLCQLNTRDMDWEVLIIDNAQEESTRSLVKRFLDRIPVQYLTETKPGKNNALNTGIQSARGKIFVFTDDDIIADPEWLGEINKGIERWPYHYVFGGRVLPEDARLIPEDFKNLREYHLIYAVADWVFPEGPYSAYKVFGPNMAVRRDLFDQGWRYNALIGPTGKNYIMGSETEFLVRLEKSGFIPIYLPRALVRHQIRPEQTTIPWLLQRAFNGGRTTALLDCAAFNGIPRIFHIPRFLIRQYIESNAHLIKAQLAGQRLKKLDSLFKIWSLKGQIYQHRLMEKT